MNQFKASGTVPKFKNNNAEFRLKVDNGSELEQFFTSEKIDTKLDYSDEKPFIKVRGKLTLHCREGDRVCLTIETYKRKDGNRIKGVDLEVL